MCLRNFKKDVNEIFGNKETMTFYKSVYFEDKKRRRTKYVSYFRYSPIYLNKETVSNRKGTNVSPSEYKSNKLSLGIHLHKKKDYSNYYCSIILEAVCNRKDYVAHNDTEIVFTKVKYKEKKKV